MFHSIILCAMAFLIPICLSQYTCLNLTNSGCHSTIDRQSCVSSKDGRTHFPDATDVYNEPCVWCGGLDCTTQSTNKCEPRNWLLAQPDRADETVYEFASCTTCSNIYGGNWVLVRHAHNQWHSATDDLAGTDVYGTYDNNAQSTATWSIEYADALEPDGSTLFMFSNGDCSEWLVTTNDQFSTQKGTDAYMAHIIASQVRNDYDVEWYHSTDTGGPIISPGKWNETLHREDTNLEVTRFNTSSDLSVNVWINSEVPSLSEPQCSAEDVGFIDTSYEIDFGRDGCVDDILEFMDDFIETIDVVYSENNLFVSSNITAAEFEKYSHLQNKTICGDITLNIFTCFDAGTDPIQLLNVTDSTEFIDDIDSEIGKKYNHTIVYRYIIVSLVIVYTWLLLIIF